MWILGKGYNAVNQIGKTQVYAGLKEYDFNINRNIIYTKAPYFNSLEIGITVPREHRLYPTSPDKPKRGLSHYQVAYTPSPRLSPPPNSLLTYSHGGAVCKLG